ncbi:hypothetical protein FHG66_13785 [Rubellimicrobium rubrum]|uniref:Uncharacterized protein n=1 Tax=Rubellimicrobium rubrum TaxID=2585369 RepID=A0A5C4MTD4_9RHOB|nr:hypothetical protein [Rubellimicrobium rubrum]TNC48605.1 hypothetical protein FHG66_13785 [Rubellimicrobium rubrum]
MGTGTAITCTDYVRHEDQRSQARWAYQKARRRTANLDREPLPPDAPDMSPVEARFSRFG